MVLLSSALPEVSVAEKTAVLEFAPGTLEARPCVSQPGEGPEMVLIAAGRFQMGSPAEDAEADSDEHPAHPVTIVKPFALARCETTVAEFGLFVSETKYVTDAERGKGCYTLNAKGDSFEQHSDANWLHPGFDQEPNYPVVCVSHNDARYYARWLSLRTGREYRLPTEAEWEYAARGGTTTTRYWGDEADAGCLYANGLDQSFKARYPESPWTHAACDDGAVFTAPVGSYRRNSFGLSDMAGNAWEWVEDCWHGSYQGAPTDGSAWLDREGGECARRVLRGGGWRDTPWFLRSALRYGDRADEAFFNVGIRLARTL